MSDERIVGLEPRAPDDEEMEVEIVSFGDEPAEPTDAAGSSAAGSPDLERQLADAREQYLRLRAEFENYRKRLDRERDEQQRLVLAAPLRELLPVVDNLERAAAAQGNLDDLRRGVELVVRQVAEVLRRFGLVEIPALGTPFDPRLHEAVTREDSVEVSTPTVVAELQRGYWLNDRLLRPALVRVAVPIEGAGDAGESAGEQAAADSPAEVTGPAPESTR